VARDTYLQTRASSASGVSLYCGHGCDAPVGLLALQRKYGAWQAPSGIGNSALAVFHPHDGRLIIRIDARQRRLVAGDVAQCPNQGAGFIARPGHAVEIAHGTEPSKRLLVRSRQTIYTVWMRIDKSWVVFAIIENNEHARCVDIFVRPDKSFGFEEFQRDVEDAGNWTPTAYFSSLTYPKCVSRR
jgi:hypothetical protein